MTSYALVICKKYLNSSIIFRSLENIKYFNKIFVVP